MSMSLSRRTALKAAGATVLAGTLTGLQSTAEAQAAEEAMLVTYPIPAGAPTNAAYSVKVRPVGGNWETLGVYLARLNLINAATGGSQVQSSSMAYFDFAGAVEVEVTYAKAAVATARVRPDSYGIQPEVSGSTVRFTLTEPRKIVVQVNDDIFDCLHLLTRKIDHNPPTADDPDVIYFGPGVHTTPDSTVQVPSGKTVYLAGGAVLKARVDFKNVEHAALRGRGVIWAAPGGTTIDGSKFITVDGVTMLNPNGYAATVGQSEHVTISDLGSFSSVGWGDGIDVFSSSHVTVDRVFMRNADDCIAIYAHRWDWYGDTKFVTVKNSTLWADVAHPINVGTHGNSDSPELIDHLTFSNLDICDHREPQMGYQGCIALNTGDSNLISNVLVDGVRVEDFREGQLIHLRVMYNTKYNTSVGRGIQSVYIKDLSYTGTRTNTCLLLGYDADHAIKDVTFENLTVNGKVIADSMKKPGWFLPTDYIPMHVNEHVHNLKFITTAEATPS